MKPFAPDIATDAAGWPADAVVRIARLERQLARERQARGEAEGIAERGLRDLYDSQQRLALIQRITDGANRASDTHMALGVAVREICCQMNWDFGNAYLVDPQTGMAQACDCWFAATPDHMIDFVEASRHAQFSPGVGLPGTVLASGAPHWMADARIDANFVRQPIARTCHIISGCAFPILIGHEVAAIIEFFSRTALTQSADLVSTLAQIAVQLGRVVERDRARATLLHDALHDALTGLPNRVLLKERCHNVFERLPPPRRGMVLLVIDLDGFKLVNDRYGHHAGDGVLIEVARRFRAALGGCQDAAAAQPGWHATLARTGGNEFVVLLDGAMDAFAPERMADAIHASLVDPLRVAADLFSVGASIGIAECGPAYENVDQMLRDADLAMYHAKAEGRRGTAVFTPGLGLQYRNRMALEREIHDAIREEQFILHYQPICALNNGGRILGYEALIRWHHPSRGLLDPGQFIPAAEETGLIVFIGDWVLREACRAMARLQAAHPRLDPGTDPGRDLPFVSINVDPQQFLQPNFAEQVRAVVMETAVSPRMIRLEVTEGVAVIDAEQTGRVLSELRDWGIKTSLDDFGTGYSSLSYLSNLPFDGLKIDRSFIASLDQAKSRNIVQTILELARNLDLSVVAEGIEEEAQQVMLREMGCVLGQGFLLGRPMREAEAFAQYQAPA